MKNKILMILSLILITSCGKGAAKQRPSPHKMVCHVVHKNRFIVRCENFETVCYYTNNGLQCKF